MKKSTKSFRVHIRGCGTTAASYDYSLLKDTNSINLAAAAILQMVDAWIDPKARQAFIYDLACKLLKSVEDGVEIKDVSIYIREDIDTVPDRLKNWEIGPIRRGRPGRPAGFSILTKRIKDEQEG